MGRIARLAAAAAAATAVVASAASLNGLSAATLQSGGEPVASCDTSFGIGYTVDSSLVTKATVTGIADPACEGGSIKITLTDGGSAVGTGSGTVPTDGDSTDNQVTLTVAEQPDKSTVDDARISIVGP